MDKFETQFEDLDVATGYYENATSSATAVGTPQEEVDRLMNQVADENGFELHQDLEAAQPAKTKLGVTEQDEDG
jgi:charged multivesicular body protein 1